MPHTRPTPTWWTAHWIEPSRLEIVMTSVVNLWLMTFLAFSLEPPSMSNPALHRMGLGISLFVTAVVASGLGGLAVSMNDVLDRRHDRAFSPQRPLPAGRLRVTTAVGLGVVSMIAALGAAMALGLASVILTVGCCIATVVYNVAGRFVPAVGIFLLGLIYAMAMTIPNPNLSFAWPLVVVVSHVMFATTVRRILAEKRPKLGRTDGWMLCVGWVFLMMIIMVVMSVRYEQLTSSAAQTWWRQRSLWIGPAVAGAGYVAAALLLLRIGWRHARSQRRAADRFGRVSWLWLVVYALSWLLSAGLWQATLITAGFAFALLVLSKLLELDRETRPRYRLSEHDDLLAPPM